jgi:hypothetical protein
MKRIFFSPLKDIHYSAELNFPPGFNTDMKKCMSEFIYHCVGPTNSCSCSSTPKAVKHMLEVYV